MTVGSDLISTSRKLSMRKLPHKAEIIAYAPSPSMYVASEADDAVRRGRRVTYLISRYPKPISVLQWHAASEEGDQAATTD